MMCRSMNSSLRLTHGKPSGVCVASDSDQKSRAQECLSVYVCRVNKGPIETVAMAVVVLVEAASPKTML